MQSKCGEGMLVLEALGEFPFFASLLSSPSSRHSLASGSKTQFSASVFTRPILGVFLLLSSRETQHCI